MVAEVVINGKCLYLFIFVRKLHFASEVVNTPVAAGIFGNKEFVESLTLNRIDLAERSQFLTIRGKHRPLLRTAGIHLTVGYGRILVMKLDVLVIDRTIRSCFLNNHKLRCWNDGSRHPAHIGNQGDIRVRLRGGLLFRHRLIVLQLRGDWPLGLCRG